MKIQVGRYYYTRDGRMAFILDKIPDKFPFEGVIMDRIDGAWSSFRLSWTECGTFQESHTEDDLDLIKEVQMSDLKTGDRVMVSGFDEKTEGLIGEVVRYNTNRCILDFGPGFHGHDGGENGNTGTFWFVPTQCLHKVGDNDGFYLVGNPARGIPTFKHRTYEDAATEAERLANNYPGEYFYIFKTIEVTQTQNVVRKEKVEPER